jgi:hypothetical protein
MVLLEAGKRVDEKSIIPGPSYLMECDSLDSFLSTTASHEFEN